MSRWLVASLALTAWLGAADLFAQSGGGTPAPDATQEKILERLQALEKMVAELNGGAAPAATAKGTDQAAVLDRLARLEKTVQDLKAGKTAAKPAPIEGVAANASLEERVQTLEKKAKDVGISISGSLDVTYLTNFNNPESRVNRLRVFDTEHNNFNVNLLDVIVQKPTAGPGSWGFRADLDFGEDPATFQATGFADGDNFELQQAYIDWIAPVGDGLRLRLGKFVTNHGAEVIESADNWNTSRSFLFGFAIPFTHTGLMATYTFFEQLELDAGIVNGWDNVDDNNDAKTFHGMLKWTASDQFNISVTGTYGAEQAGKDKDMRGLVTLLATIAPWENWTFMLDLDYGTEANAAVGALAGQDANWFGAAAYARYQIAPTWYAAARGEYFNDDEGARMGTVGQHVWEGTITLGWKPIDPAEVRLEYRNDWAEEAVFDQGEGLGGETDQGTISLEAIYRF